MSGLSSNPEIKNQIYSLYLSNKDTCQTRLFISRFSLRQFSNLRTLTLLECTKYDLAYLKWTLPSLTHLSCLHLINCKLDIENKLSKLPIFQLQILTVPNLFWEDQLLEDISSIINLTITYCNLNEFHQILTIADRLNYLNVSIVRRQSEIPAEDDKYFGTTSHVIHLKRLIIGNYEHYFEDIVMILQRTINLKSLTLHAIGDDNMIDASKWEHLITSYLPYLKIFNFIFTYNRSSEEFSFEENMKRFQH
jgi:hypothetical protein